MSQIVWMHTASRVVDERSARWVHPYTGAILDVADENNLPTFTDESGTEYHAVLLDVQTASMLHHVWSNLSPENQTEFATYGLGGAVELGWKVVEKAGKRQSQQNSEQEQPDE